MGEEKTVTKQKDIKEVFVLDTRNNNDDVVNPIVPPDYVAKKPVLASMAELQELFKDSDFFHEKKKTLNADLQKGMSSAISSRFTKSTKGSSIKKPIPIKEHVRVEFRFTPEARLCKRFGVPALEFSKEESDVVNDRYQREVGDFIKPINESSVKLQEPPRPVDFFKAILEESSSSDEEEIVKEDQKKNKSKKRRRVY